MESEWVLKHQCREQHPQTPNALKIVEGFEPGWSLSCYEKRKKVASEDPCVVVPPQAREGLSIKRLLHTEQELLSGG